MCSAGRCVLDGRCFTPRDSLDERCLAPRNSLDGGCALVGGGNVVGLHRIRAAPSTRSRLWAFLRNF